MDSTEIGRDITIGIESHRSLEMQGRVLGNTFKAERGIENGGHKVFDEMPKLFFNSKSQRILLVTVINAIHPICESVLHQVFDRYGKIDMIYILPVKEGFQALIRYDYLCNASIALSELQGKHIYDGCCKLDIQFISKEFLEKAEYYCGMCVDSWDEVALKSCLFEIMLELKLKEVAETKNHKVFEEMTLKKTSTTSCEFPVFDGYQPREWIRDCEEYFQLHSTSEKYKVTLAMTYMEGRTRRWRKCYDARMADPTWPEFASAL